MVKNYLKIAIRTLLRHKVFSFINIFGLAVSFSISFLLIMMVADQKSYDRHNSHKDRIFRVNTHRLSSDGLVNRMATAPLPIANVLKEEYTGIEEVVRIRRGFGNDWVGIVDNVNIPIGGFFTDPSFLNVFEYELEFGDPNTALNDPFSVVLTREVANKLFKLDNPVGEIITVGELGDYMVTGILKETDNKSHIVFEALASMSSVERLESDSTLRPSLNNWGRHTVGWVYLLLDENKPVKGVEDDLAEIYKPRFEELLKTHDLEDIDLKLYLQSITAITPGPLLGNQIGPGLPNFFIYFLGGLALIIIISACFNYTNLSIARALTRAREVGIRKVSGAQRYQIFGQFIGESIIISLFSLVLALGFLVFLKPAFLMLNVTQFMKWDLQADLTVYLICLVFSVGVGTIAGFFPALFLSSFQPVKVQKGDYSLGS